MHYKKHSEQDIIENSLKLIKECPVCSTKYILNCASVVDKNENGFLMYFSCAHCSSSLLANIIEMPFGLVGSAMLTDLELNEVQKFKNKQPVTTDDVLGVYKYLEK